MSNFILDSDEYIQQKLNNEKDPDFETDQDLDYETDSDYETSNDLYNNNNPYSLDNTDNDDNTNKLEYSDDDQKYGDNEKYEPVSDNYLFFPLANKLVTPMKDIGLTPNMVTFLSTCCTLLAVYFIYKENLPYAATAYLIGYLLDCVDGKMARKYNMGSQYGMVLDLVSDNVTNFILLIVIVYKYGYFNWFVPCILIMTRMISLSYGLNEAIASYKETGNDNFLLRRQIEIGETDDILFNLFLFINGLSYSSYRHFFPNYDEKKINKWLSTLKEFGPGNYTLFIAFVILNLPKSTVT